MCLDIGKRVQSKQITYESCGIAMLIRSLLQDPRIANAISWEPKQSVRDSEPVFAGVETAEQFREMYGHFQRNTTGCKFLALTASKTKHGYRKMGMRHANDS